MSATARIVQEGRLRLSASPTAVIAAAAYEAMQKAGLPAADFIVVAVAPGRAGDELAAEIERVCEAAGAGEAVPAKG